jgi:hypothetical protein
VTSAAVAAATTRLPSPLAISAPVTVDFANMTLIVRRPDTAGGYEKLLWREAHQALVKAEESGWTGAPTVYGSAPGAYRFGYAAPASNLTLIFGFLQGTAEAKVYANLVGRPALFAFVSCDKSTRHFLGVSFRHSR